MPTSNFEHRRALAWANGNWFRISDPYVMVLRRGEPPRSKRKRVLGFRYSTCSKLGTGAGK